MGQKTGKLSNHKEERNQSFRARDRTADHFISRNKPDSENKYTCFLSYVQSGFFFLSRRELIWEETDDQQEVGRCQGIRR